MTTATVSESNVLQRTLQELLDDFGLDDSLSPDEVQGLFMLFLAEGVNEFADSDVRCMIRIKNAVGICAFALNQSLERKQSGSITNREYRAKVQDLCTRTCEKIRRALWLRSETEEDSDEEDRPIPFEIRKWLERH